MKRVVTAAAIWFGIILIALSAMPLIRMGTELYYADGVRRELLIDRIYVNFLALNKVEILGEGAPIPVRSITVRNEWVSGNERKTLESKEDYDRAIRESALDNISYAREYTWAGNHIRIEDRIPPGSYSEDSRVGSALTVSVNGKDWTEGSLVEVRPIHLDENRYHGYFGLLAVQHKGEERLVLVQRIGDFKMMNEEALAWRTLTIDKEGQVTEDRFRYTERGDVPERVNFINAGGASPIALGYRSNILHYWPSLFFPLLYPFGTGLLGLFIFLIGLFGFVRYRKRKSGFIRE